jgi:protein O-GlcNAc transferase
MDINKTLQLASEYHQEGNLRHAANLCIEILDINPNHSEAQHLLGIICYQLGNYDYAIELIKKVLQLNPNNDRAFYNLAIVFEKKGQFDDAMIYYQKALQLNPNSSDAYLNSGNLHSFKGQLGKAITCYQKALQLNPNLFDIYNNLGHVYKDQGQLNEAEGCFRSAIKMDPTLSSLYSNLLSTMQYNARYDAQTIYFEHLKFSKQYAEPFASALSPHINKRNLIRKLRIGYISPDFRRHPVSSFIEPVLIAHNRDHFEVFCYSNSLRHDEVTKRIQEYADQWRNIVGISDQEVTELIRKDEIDILVDLAGHTANNRMLVFARKPAPIQISWIGYLATTGLSTIDYKISDNYADPFGQTEQFYTENLIRLPESFLCYLPDQDSPDVGPLPALSAGHITFGSFNNFSKVTPEVFSVWAKILKELPDSHLILKGKSFHDTATCHYAINMFTKRGIASERITLQPSDPAPKHMESYNLVDIGLDAFPFNGATTTCEAMWMGVPVITLAGTAYHSRSGVSLLSNLGIPELVAKTSDAYISLAVNLANDLKRLQSLRESLRDMMKCSPVCDAKRFTANLEICYRQMWRKWCKSL